MENNNRNELRQFMSDFKKEIPESLKAEVATIDPKKLILPAIAFIVGGVLSLFSFKVVNLLWDEYAATHGPEIYIGAMLTAIFIVQVQKK